MAYKKYQGIALAADVIGGLVMLSDSGYRLAASQLTEPAKLKYGRDALRFAYSPITAALRRLGPSAVEQIQPDLKGIANVRASIVNLVGNIAVPSFWASVAANILSGH